MSLKSPRRPRRGAPGDPSLEHHRTSTEGSTMINARTLTGSVAVAAVSAGLAINGATDGSAIEAPRTLTLSTSFVGGKTKHIDLGKKGDSAGDMFLSTGAPLRDEQTGRRVGAVDGME